MQDDPYAPRYRAAAPRADRWVLPVRKASVAFYFFCRHLIRFLPFLLPPVFLSVLFPGMGHRDIVIAAIVGAAVFMGVILALIASKQAQVLSYELEPGVLRVNEGFLFISRKTLPLDRIADITYAEDPFMRICGIGVLRVQTSGQGSALPEATLYGIVDQEAVLKELLSRRDAYIATLSHRA